MNLRYAESKSAPSQSAAGSQASGRAAGLFKSVQADELRTRLARRSIERAVSFAEWSGADLDVRRSGSFLIARTGEHQEMLRREARQSHIHLFKEEARLLPKLFSRYMYEME